jgi:3-hydroxybutyryl-CoA dehydrogenase
MKVVEVVAGLKTDAAVVRGWLRYARQLGHTPVVWRRTRRASSSTMPGAATAPNRCASCSEGVADFATIDRILREQVDQVGFKLGPFELMDLTASMCRTR